MINCGWYIYSQMELCICWTQIMREFQQQHNNTDSNKTKDNLRKQRQTQFVVSAHKAFLWNIIRNVSSKAIRLILFKLNSWNNCIKEFIFLLVKKMVWTIFKCCDKQRPMFDHCLNLQGLLMMLWLKRTCF